MKTFFKIAFFFGAAAGLISQSCSSDKNAPATEFIMYAGSYAPADSSGIKVFAVNPDAGSFRLIGQLRGIDNPSYLAVSDDGSRIYSVGEGENSTVNAITFSCSTGEMNLTATVNTGGGAPCYIAISPDSGYVVSANYNGGNISIFPLASDGNLTGECQVVNFNGTGPDSLRQTQPRLHCVTFTPDSRYLVADDLGTDRLHIFPVSEKASQLIDTAAMRDVEIAPASGPRHLAYHPSGRYAYLINEISGYVTLLDYDGETLVPRQYALADTLHAEGAADIAVSADGLHLYASCRLQGDGVAVFDIDPADGSLTRAGYTLTGIHPRNIALTPDGRYLAVACRDTDVIEFYPVDNATGLLSPATFKVEMSRPVCVKFMQE